MGKELFRKEAIENINSPDELDKYIKVCNPSTWLILASIFILVAGFFSWAIFGKLDTRIKTVVVSNEGNTLLFLKTNDLDESLDKICRFNDNEITLKHSMLESEAFEVSKVLKDYEIEVGGFKKGEYVYILNLDINVTAGVYEATIITGRESPILMLFN